MTYPTQPTAMPPANLAVARRRLVCLSLRVAPFIVTGVVSTR